MDFFIREFLFYDRFYVVQIVAIVCLLFREQFFYNQISLQHFTIFYDFVMCTRISCIKTRFVHWFIEWNLFHRSLCACAPWNVIFTFESSLNGFPAIDIEIWE